MSLTVQPGRTQPAVSKLKTERRRNHFTMGDTGYDPKFCRLMNRDKKKLGKQKRKLTRV